MSVTARLEQENRARFWMSIAAFLSTVFSVRSGQSSIPLILTLLFAGYALLIALSQVFFHRPRLQKSLPYVLIAADAVLVSALVYLQGSPGSLVVALYLFVVGAPALSGRLSHLTYAAVLSVLLYAGTVALLLGPGLRPAAVAGPAVLMLTLVVAAVRLPWILRLREQLRDRQMSRAACLLAICDELNGSPGGSSEKIRAITRLLADEFAGDSIRCRIVLTSESPFLPPPGAALGTHVPIRIEGRHLGALVIATPDGVPLTPIDQEFAETVARSIALFVRRDGMWEDVKRRLSDLESSMLIKTAEGSLRASARIDAPEERQMVETMLDMVRLQQGQWKLEQVPCRFSELAARALDGARRAMSPKKMILKLEGDFGEAPVFVGDAARLCSALENGLMYVAAFSPDGTSIVLHADFDEGAFSGRIERVGLAAGVRRLDGQAKNVGGNSRADLELGFKLARRVFEAHRGLWWSEAPTGDGRTIHFSLPAVAHKEARPV